jgi:glycosyltransferase involved in cell wall biosynthesis
MAEPLVSVITIFLDEERFLAEAVESVLAQTYTAWELLLCDDGSTDGSTALAREYAARHPDRIRYLEHPEHENRGMSAARNLGLRHARGEFVALLDADDRWLPGKLDLQVAALQAHPEVALVYGPSLYWHSWTGRPEDRSLDALSRTPSRPHRVTPGRRALSRILRGRADALCTCSLLVRRHVLLDVGGFEDRFRGLFEDQAFLSKLLIAHDLLAVEPCTDLYRQHADSCCASAHGSAGMTMDARRSYLVWLRDYLEGRSVGPGLRWALRRELAVHRVPGLAPARERWRLETKNVRGKAILASLAVGRRLVPERLRTWLWDNVVQSGSRSP